MGVYDVMLLSILTWSSNGCYKASFYHVEALGKSVCYTSDIVCCSNSHMKREKGVCIQGTPESLIISNNVNNLCLLQMFFRYYWIFQCRLSDNLSSRNLVFCIGVNFSYYSWQRVCFGWFGQLYWSSRLKT